MKNNSTALVLEGGGMRGVFTCGVLDYFMDNEIRFPYTIGVSAGACNGLSYMSRQRGRAKFSNIDMLEKYQYIGMKYLLKQHNIMDFDLLFSEFPERILPYDYSTYFSSSERFVIVTTNCMTGTPCYYEEKKDKDRLLTIVRASSSLPFVCPLVMLDGIPMLDGGISDSIPIRQAMAENFSHYVVVLTRNRGYRKNEKEKKLPRFLYHKYPQLREALLKRNRMYNAQIEWVEELENKGEVTVIRPQHPLMVGRIEKNIQKLTDLYQEGYEVAKETYF